MTIMQKVIGYLGVVLSVAGAGWLVWQRKVRKAELTKAARAAAATILALALICYFFAMPAASWVRIIGVGVAIFMLLMSLAQLRREARADMAIGASGRRGRTAVRGKTAPTGVMTRKEMPWHKEKKKRKTHK